LSRFRGTFHSFDPVGLTVLDRFIQQAVMQVLQKQWNPTFSLRIPEQAAHDSGMMPPTHSEIIPPTVPR
jgi:hypothetical protein